LKKKQNKDGLITLKEAHKEIGTFSLHWFRRKYINCDKDIFVISKLNVIRPSVMSDIFVEPAELERYKVKGHEPPPSRAACANSC
jgi:hypothetical protein